MTALVNYNNVCVCILKRLTHLFAYWLNRHIISLGAATAFLFRKKKQQQKPKNISACDCVDLHVVTKLNHTSTNIFMCIHIYLYISMYVYISSSVKLPKPQL